MDVNEKNAISEHPMFKALVNGAIEKFEEDFK